MSYAQNNISDQNNDRLLKFLPVFLREMDACISQLSTSIDRVDILSSRETLHQMIGAARIINDQALEKEIILLQQAIKATQSQQKIGQIFQEVKKHIERLFAWQMEFRSKYTVHVVVQKPQNLSTINSLLRQNGLVNCSSSASLAAFRDWLVQNEADLWIIDSEDNPELLEGVSHIVNSEYLETPLLMIEDSLTVDLEGSRVKYPNLAGVIQRTDERSSWMEAIKTIVNGRSYWQT